MNLTYDAEADVLAVHLAGGVRARTQRLAGGIRIEFDDRDRLVLLEVQRASLSYPVELLLTVNSPAQWLTLKEAASEAGLSPAVLRQLVHRKKLAATKRGHDWLVTRAALWTYLENRKRSGRPPTSAKGRALREQRLAKAER